MKYIGCNPMPFRLSYHLSFRVDEETRQSQRLQGFHSISGADSLVIILCLLRRAAGLPTDNIVSLASINAVDKNRFAVTFFHHYFSGTMAFMRSLTQPYGY